MIETKIKISDQATAIQHFFETMDIEMIEAFLDNDKTYQDWKKSKFINKLTDAFNQFKSFGDSKLTSYSGSCGICDKSKSGFTFVGNNSENYMSIIFDVAEGKINDLYECSVFKSNRSDLKLNERIYIDEVKLHPF
jgi:hypothetical protein